ncbi:DUF4974 domain-containing protein [Pseudoflavitalea sp. G-6-1-2]|uniref:FecR family protein n=1 Tax=Pseudoflavitalea sp. G-6-1-2 TaxID=2728841 RepID=UPI00146E383F|nr:FecR domain-containing protein [Pseudoflavitalea sp. G-6-1-2]NML22249.1 DUF4974 domain-containing protein [Pseudoflavitalea sp. G-6-1-2]
MEQITVEYLLQQKSFLQYCLQSDDAAVRQWEQYLQAHPEEAAVVHEAASIVRDSALYMQAETLKPAAVDRLRQSIQEEETVQPPVRKMLWKRIAVAAAIIGIIALVLFWMLPAKKAQQPIAARSKMVITAGDSSYNIPARKMLALQDGSFVLLDSGASIRIDPAFGTRERRVYLSGTAWFKAAKNSQHPFRVITGNIRTTALGTAFRVDASQGAASVQIELEEGKVAVERISSAGTELLATLMPSESIKVYQQQNRTTQKLPFAADRLQAWKAQEIIFNDAPVADVLSQLQVLYNQPILLEDTLLNGATFTGRFGHDSLSTVLDLLCFSLNKKYRTTADNKILIY